MDGAQNLDFLPGEPNLPDNDFTSGKKTWLSSGSLCRMMAIEFGGTVLLPMARRKKVSHGDKVESDRNGFLFSLQ
jgi:hypothetical protein